MNKRFKLLLFFFVSLMLAAVMAAPAAAAQDADAGVYQWMYYQNPLYPDAPVHSQRLMSDRQAARKEPVCRNTLQEAAADLREGMKNREETITVAFLAPGHERELISTLFDVAVAHTGEPTEGDYILWHCNGWGASMSSRFQGGQYRNEVTYTVRYLSTAVQEEKLDTAVRSLLDQLDVYDAGDYEKVLAIYDFICKNIEYDYVDTQQAHTAYAALIEGKSVCQGYASLFYRLALALDVDTRIISGIGNGGPHGWNIVKLNGRYYALDSTWDAIRKQNNLSYEYFLRCDANFLDHMRDEEYLTQEFQKIYLMAQKDYAQGAEILPGDLDDNNDVDEGDALYLLQYILMPEVFSVTQAVDYDKNSIIDENDVIYLLQYLLMPEIFPI